MTEKKEFDEFLGGSQSLAHEVSILKMVAARASEIAAMTYSIENPEQTKLLFQKLPIYMRRRVMSHNVKRLPRRLRQAHLNQLSKSGLPPKSKRPSRKHRRRPSNLLAEYNRRQRNNRWLETHIWHAKRFRMVRKWGYSIASRPNDKCFRANYRAITDACLLQDVSYYICVEIKGQENLLKTTLKAHCNPSVCSFAAIKYTDGRNEGTVMFFRRNGYPRHPIGNVHFLWRSYETPDVRSIWIWVHPAFYEEFLGEIKSSFGFGANGGGDAADAARCATTSISYTSDTGCEMTVNEMNRFRLLGPSTVKVLTEVLRLPSLTELGSETNRELRPTAATKERGCSLNREKTNGTPTGKNVLSRSAERMEIDEEAGEDNATTTVAETSSPRELRKHKAWHAEYCKRDENMSNFTMQKEWWEDLSRSRSFTALPSSVIGLTVLDPRFYLPERRAKCRTEAGLHAGPFISVPADLTRSPIWDARIRRIASNSCASTSAINDLRSECLVPGVSNDQYFSEDVMAKIPVLLIPKHGMINEVVGHGVDVVIPLNWAMPFLLALVRRCVRVGALQESKAVAFEGLNTFTPDVNDPDTPAYAREAVTAKQELIERYFRRPPNKRINFTKFGIGSPFFCDWRNLMKDWSDTEDFYVLRDRKLLWLLQAGIRPLSSARSGGPTNRRSTAEQVDLQNFNEYRSCLVRIKVFMLCKGSPKEFAIVCAPTSEDLETFNSNKKWGGPVERRHDDPNETARLKLREDHLLKLKRLRRKRVRQKRARMEDDESESVSKKHVGGWNVDDCGAAGASHRKMISEQWERMSKLWLPENTRVRHSCGRQVMGYLTMADFSLSHAKGMGIGYVALPSLIEMIGRKSNIVLVRNVQTRQYRLATCDILDEYV